MEKIPTVFERDWDNDPSRVLNQVVPGCEWVLEGEGKPTQKYDGVCVRLDEDGKWWARREVKDGRPKPDGFVTVGHDHKTLAAYGWEPIEGTPFHKFFVEAEANGPEWDTSKDWEPGTYELVGPKVNKNNEDTIRHGLLSHERATEIPDFERTYEGIKAALEHYDVEGFVFHHEDGRRMAKIKKRDFGIKRT